MSEPTWHDFFVCQNCQRMTVSMLCGCERPVPLGPFQLVMAPHEEGGDEDLGPLSPETVEALREKGVTFTDWQPNKTDDAA